MSQQLPVCEATIRCETLTCNMHVIFSDMMQVIIISQHFIVLAIQLSLISTSTVR